jgi:aminoglycoside phosphotransferase (APT) family kinase protein
VGNGGERQILVKSAREDVSADDFATQPREPDRPRLAPGPGPTSGIEREAEVLEVIERHAAGDPRFAAIPVLDVLPDPPAIVMGQLRGQSLRRILMRAAIVRGPRSLRRSQDALASAGAWLRAFHALPVLPTDGRRLGSRSALLEVARPLIAFGIRTLERDALGPAEAWLEAMVSREEGSLTSGLLHGDFASRNILVDAQGRVAVFDSRARWVAPVAEDIAQMLVSMRLAREQVTSTGRLYPVRLIESWESSLLGGYFGADHVPWPTIRVFELLVLLDKWAAIVGRSRREHRARVAAELVAPSYRRRIEELMAPRPNPNVEVHWPATRR